MPSFRHDAFTVATPTELYGALDRAWRALLGEVPKRSSLLVLLAQSALETGRWHSMHCWNVGNAKGRPDGSDGHDWTYFACDEVDAKGVRHWYYPPSPVACFRAFATLDDGVDDYLSLLHRHFAPAWSAVMGGDPATFVQTIKSLGYFTADEKTYEANVVSIFHEFDRTIGIILDIGDPSLLDLHTLAGVQTALNELGEHPALVVDGKNGPHTKAAVRHFQALHGLVADGIAGPATAVALATALTHLAR